MCKYHWEWWWWCQAEGNNKRGIQQHDDRNMTTQIIQWMRKPSTDKTFYSSHSYLPSHLESLHYFLNISAVRHYDTVLTLSRHNSHLQRMYTIPALKDVSGENELQPLDALDQPFQLLALTFCQSESNNVWNIEWARIVWLVQGFTTGWMVWGSNSGGARSSAPIQISPVQWVPGHSHADVKWPGHGINYPLPSSAEVEERVKPYL